MLQMQNREYKRKITAFQKETKEVKQKQISELSEIEQAYFNLFSTNESLKLYDKTITELQKAIQTEKVYVDTVKGQVKELRKLLAEEVKHKEQFKGLACMQKKNIDSLGMK